MVVAKQILDEKQQLKDVLKLWEDPDQISYDVYIYIVNLSYYNKEIFKE
jgi:hypothetical protein